MAGLERTCVRRAMLRKWASFSAREMPRGSHAANSSSSTSTSRAARREAAFADALPTAHPPGRVRNSPPARQARLHRPRPPVPARSRRRGRSLRPLDSHPPRRDGVFAEARGDARWFQLCAFTPGGENAYLPTSRARHGGEPPRRGRPPPPEPTMAPASRASKRKFWSRRRRGADAQALRLQWVAAGGVRPPRAGRAGWRLALESFEPSAFRRAGAGRGAAGDGGRRYCGARCASSPPPCSHARACASPAAAAAGRRRRGAPPPAAAPQLLAATTRLLQEQVLNSGG